MQLTPDMCREVIGQPAVNAAYHPNTGYTGFFKQLLATKAGDMHVCAQAAF